MVVINPDQGGVSEEVASRAEVTAAKKQAEEQLAAAVLAAKTTPLRYASSAAITPEAGGPTLPIGSTALELAANGRLGIGASPYFDAYTKRDMKPGFDPNSNRMILPNLDLLQIADPSELAIGRRAGLNFYTPATGLTVAGFTVGTDETITLEWQPAVIAEWIAQGIIKNAGEMPNPNAGFVGAGRVQIEVPGGGEHFAVVNVTGVEGTNKIKVSKVGFTLNGAALFAAGHLVNQLLDTGTTLGFIDAQPWSGQGGFQDRAGQIGFQLVEPHQRTVDGGYQTGGKIIVTPTTRGEGSDSERRESMEWEPDGSMILLGGYAEDSTKVIARTTLGGPWARLGAAEGDPASGTVVVKDSLDGWPTGGTHYASDGAGNVFSYTGITQPKTFTGTAVVSGGKLPASSKLKLAEREKYVALGVPGGQVVANFGRAGVTAIGNIGATAATPEAGILAGGDTYWLRREAAVWETIGKVIIMQGSATACISLRDSSAPTVKRWEALRTGILEWFNAAEALQAKLEIRSSGSAGLKLTGALEVTSDLVHTGTKSGLNAAAPIVKAAAITSPAETLAALKTAVDKIREAIKNIGITE